MVWIQMKYIWKPYTIQLPVTVSYISSFVQSSEFHPAVCYCLIHLQFWPVNWIPSSCLWLSHMSPVLYSHLNSIQLSVTVPYISSFVQSIEFHPAVCYCLLCLQFCPIHWIPSSCLLLSHTSPVLTSQLNSIQLSVTVPYVSSFVQSFEFHPAVCDCPIHLQFCPVHWIPYSCLLLSHTSPVLSSPVNPISAACVLYAVPFCFSFLHSPLRFSIHFPLKPSYINDTFFRPSAPASSNTNPFTWKIEAVIPLWCWKEQNTLSSVKTWKTFVIETTAAMTTWKLCLGHYVLNLQCWSRCTVWTFTFWHEASLGAPLVHECIEGYSKLTRQAVYL